MRLTEALSGKPVQQAPETPAARSLWQRYMDAQKQFWGNTLAGVRDVGQAVGQYATERPLETVAASGVPIASDVAGLVADAKMYAQNPESRTALNFGLTGLGALPFVPAMAASMRHVSEMPELPRGVFEAEVPSWNKQMAGGAYTIAKNPTVSDLKRLFREAKGEDLRVIIDKATGDRYFWNGNAALHDDVGTAAGLSPKTTTHGRLTMQMFEDQLGGAK